MTGAKMAATQAPDPDRDPGPDGQLDIVPANEAPWGEVHVGARQVFEEAGFTELTHPTARRVVMRIDFRPG
jgi:hypothetical protein